jgi:hypothetical protein
MPSLENWLHSSRRVGRLRPGADARWIGEIEVSVGVENCCTREVYPLSPTPIVRRNVLALIKIATTD